MDYIPVYEGEDVDDGSVKLSPGKIQRTGVKSEPAAPRVIRTAIRAPGTIQLDERRVSVISMRSESWVQKVTNVTTGTRVDQGPAADGNLQPVDLSGCRRIHRDHQFQDHRRLGRLWTRLASAADEPRRSRSCDISHGKERRGSDRHRMDGAARRHRSRTQCDRRDARAARRRAVPGRGHIRRLGDGRCRRARSWCACRRSVRHCPGARLCWPRVRREDQRDLSAGEPGDPNGPRQS